MDFYNAFYNLAKINKIDLNKKANFNPHTIGLVAENLTLKDMIRLSATDKKMKEIMKPIIENKRQELEELKNWLSNLPIPQNYTIEQLDQLQFLEVESIILIEIPELNLPNLKTLILSNDFLTSMPTLTLLPNLEELSLEDNRLTEIPTLNHPNLKKLNLNNNNLTTIPNLNLPNLQQLYLISNPLPETEKARLRSIYGDKVIF